VPAAADRAQSLQHRRHGRRILDRHHRVGAAAGFGRHPGWLAIEPVEHERRRSGRSIVPPEEE
jgi:hypothetical protein